jgi:hypothetical protein
LVRARPRKSMTPRGTKSQCGTAYQIQQGARAAVPPSLTGMLARCTKTQGREHGVQSESPGDKSSDVLSVPNFQSEFLLRWLAVRSGPDCVIDSEEKWATWKGMLVSPAGRLACCHMAVCACTQGDGGDVRLPPRQVGWSVDARFRNMATAWSARRPCMSLCARLLQPASWRVISHAFPGLPVEQEVTEWHAHEVLCLLDALGLLPHSLAACPLLAAADKSAWEAVGQPLRLADVADAIMHRGAALVDCYTFYVRFGLETRCNRSWESDDASAPAQWHRYYLARALSHDGCRVVLHRLLCGHTTVPRIQQKTSSKIQAITLLAFLHRLGLLHPEASENLARKGRVPPGCPVVLVTTGALTLACVHHLTVDELQGAWRRAIHLGGFAALNVNFVKVVMPRQRCFFRLASFSGVAPRLASWFEGLPRKKGKQPKPADDSSLQAALHWVSHSASHSASHPAKPGQGGVCLAA